MSEEDYIALQIEANIDQAEVNTDAIGTILAQVKAARWRLIRNRRLLDSSWRLLRANQRLIAENNVLLARRQLLINAHRA